MEELKADFEGAGDEYLEYCKEADIEPEKHIKALSMFAFLRKLTVRQPDRLFGAYLAESVYRKFRK